MYRMTIIVSDPRKMIPKIIVDAKKTEKISTFLNFQKSSILRGGFSEIWKFCCFLILSDSFRIEKYFHNYFPCIRNNIFIQIFIRYMDYTTYAPQTCYIPNIDTLQGRGMRIDDAGTKYALFSY